MSLSLNVLGSSLLALDAGPPFSTVLVGPALSEDEAHAVNDPIARTAMVAIAKALRLNASLIAASTVDWSAPVTVPRPSGGEPDVEALVELAG